MSFCAYSMLFSCLLFLSVLPVKADQTTQVRQLIQAAYDKQDTAYHHKDAKGVMTIYAPNWTTGTSSYKVLGDRQNDRELLAKLFSVRGYLTIIQKITSFHRQGNQAVAIVNYRMTVGPSKYLGFVDNGFKTTSVNQDTWELTQNGWLMTRSYMGAARSDGIPGLRVIPPRDYARVAKLALSVTQTHTISDADLDWTLSLLHRPFPSTSRSRAMIVLFEIRPMSAAQKAIISPAIKPYLNSKDPLDAIGAERVQTALEGKLWTAMDGKRWNAKHGYPLTGGKPIK